MSRTINQFLEDVTSGATGPSESFEFPNMGGDQIHMVSFSDQCDELCKKNKIDKLRLLSVLQEKLNADMIVRLRKSPVFLQKIQDVMGEWGKADTEPSDLFKCPDSCYDMSHMRDLTDRISTCDNEFKALDTESGENDSGLYDAVERLRGEYHGCSEDLQRNMIEIDERQREYEPEYHSILSDLSTRHKPFYLAGQAEEGSGNMNVAVNKRLNRDIPDKIHRMFLNGVLMPPLIEKEMSVQMNKCHKLKHGIDEKQEVLGGIMDRIGPGEPYSLGLMDFISGLGFNNNGPPSEDELPTDDEDDYESDNEEKLEKIMNSLVSKRDTATEDKLYHLDFSETDDDDTKMRKKPKASKSSKSKEPKGSPKKKQGGGGDDGGDDGGGYDMSFF